MLGGLTGFTIGLFTRGVIGFGGKNAPGAGSVLCAGASIFLSDATPSIC